MEQKVRFKMHKVKKNWVTIGVTALSMVTVAGGTLLADQQVQADEQNPANQSSDSSQDLLQETPATTNDVATTVAPTISADANTASVAIPVADATSTTTNATDRAAASASNVATVQTNSGQAAPSTNVQPAATDTSATATDTNTNTNTNASVTATDRVATTDRAATTDTENTEAHTRSRRALVETREANTNTSTGIQWINGKQYYVNSDGSVRKNFVFEQDGKSYYFDAETGALATKSQDEFSTEPIKATVDFSSGNQLYKNDDKSLDQLDTFITADAWYRPKSILKDGKTWTASTEADKRPLLMVWWPDKSTQVNYLNYMQNQGLGAGSFSTNSSQESLDQALKRFRLRLKNVSRVKATQTGCVQVSTSSSRLSQVGIVALKIVPMTTCKVDSCSLTTVRVILATVPATPTLTIVCLTAHRLTKRVHVSTSRTILSVVSSSCLPTILITQIQQFRQNNLTGSTL